MDAFKHFVLQEWYFALPMFLMSLAGVSLVIWRQLLNNGAKTRMSHFMPEFQKVLKEKGVEGAIKFCRTSPGMIPSKLFVAGLEASKQGVSAMKRSMASTIRLEILPDLNFLLAPILAIAKIATMVGLLGTVISMINTFDAIGKAQTANPAAVTSQTQAIGLALFATALGLMTAIPLVFTHVLFKDWVHRFENQLEAAANKLVMMAQNANRESDVSRAAKTAPV
jgi:biopolymer transport protein ExbB